MAEPRPAERFADLGQQEEVAALGIWAFLATEVLFFGGLIAAYLVYRIADPAGFAEAGRHAKVAIGTINTAVLLTSSFAVAWAVEALRAGGRRQPALLLAIAGALGAAFLGLKGFEYLLEYREHLVPGLNFAETGPHARTVELFFLLYFLLTGIHGLHVLIGVAAVGTMAVRTWRGAFSPRQLDPVEVTGLYWHFVDIVWIFLYPLIYLLGRSGG
jgi:cytochrome c oxidase subunit 3